MNLSIIIVSWNTVDLLRRCLASVYADLPPAEMEVLVVDNASTDGSPEMVRAEFPQVTLLVNRQNVGFAAANNQAIRQSQGRYVLLLNPDTEVKPGALSTLLHFMDAHPEAGGCGPRLLNPDGSLQTSCYPAPTLARELWRLLHLDRVRPYGVYRMDDWPQNVPREVDVLLGACLLVRREAFQQVGLLSEDYFIYSEEVDLCYRLRQAGWSLVWVPQAQVVHFGGQSTRQVAAEMFLHLYRGKLLYFRKNHGWASAQIYRLILLVTALARLALTPLAWLEPPARRQEHLTLAGHYGRLVKVLAGQSSIINRQS
ncbi:MAG: glycosyltransferase family 2 protein [Chloroflexi bacterium]|nr:MAG: glycosyltransferase family 2 protein [Chloroflexota bacterium]